MYKKSCFVVPIYDCYIHVFVADNLSRVCRYYSTEPISKDECDNDRGFFLPKKHKGNYVIALHPTEADETTVSHESLHAAKQILSDCGISNLTSDNEEVETYLCSYIVLQVAKRFKKLRKRK